MTSVPSQQHKTSSLGDSSDNRNNDNDTDNVVDVAADDENNCSVSSAGTDRASNHQFPISKKEKRKKKKKKKKKGGGGGDQMDQTLAMQQQPPPASSSSANPRRGKRAKDHHHGSSDDAPMAVLPIPDMVMTVGGVGRDVRSFDDTTTLTLPIGHVRDAGHVVELTAEALARQDSTASGASEEGTSDYIGVVDGALGVEDVSSLDEGSLHLAVEDEEDSEDDRRAACVPPEEDRRALSIYFASDNRQQLKRQDSAAASSPVPLTYPLVTRLSEQALSVHIGGGKDDDHDVDNLVSTETIVTHRVDDDASGPSSLPFSRTEFSALAQPITSSSSFPSTTILPPPSPSPACGGGGIVDHRRIFPPSPSRSPPPKSPTPSALYRSVSDVNSTNGANGSGNNYNNSTASPSLFAYSPFKPRGSIVGGGVAGGVAGGGWAADVGTTMTSFLREAESNGNINIAGSGSLTRQSSNTSSSSMGANSNNNNACGGATRIRLGICAMDKKARSKPMNEILKRLDPTAFEPIFFGDYVILNEPVESWPICDVLIAFYSNGYPLEKAESYVALRRPYLLNDLKMQRTLMDRRRVYDLLEESGIDVPRHVFVSRDGYISTGTGDGDGDADGQNGGGIAARARSSSFVANDDEPEVDEHDDHIEVNGVIINKPFVEKPVDADDHNIAIYYPSSAGGGCKKLFRKVGDRSSEFYPEINEIRRDGSYIYETFMETQGTDVKMYTVGPDYGHAEARKSPAVDGKVERNDDGKEVRFPVILTLREKEIARRIVMVFKQQVCGFDILRIQEGDSLVSYVCDVNGWSFVKNSRKYYDDCALILTEHMLAARKPKSKVSFSALAPLLATMEDPVDFWGGKSISKKKKHHRGPSIADRVKMMLMGEGGNAEGENDDGVKDEENDKLSELGLSDDLCKVNGGEGNEDFSTNPVRNLPDQLATEPASSASIAPPSGNSSLADADDVSSLSGKDHVAMAPTTHQEELRCVITIIRHGDRTPKQKLKGDINGEHFLRYYHDHSPKVKKDLKVKAKKQMIEFLETVNAVIDDLEAKGVKKNRDALYKARHIRDILQRWKFSGLNRKLQMKPRKWIEEETLDGDTITKCSELQLIVKWGGDLTKLGEKQAVRLGNRLRTELYPSNRDGGILRLHSTFRHDLKIKTSDEGRVMKTAAAFAKGLLELEGDIPPILVSLVHKEKDSLHMLDPSGNKEVEKDLDKCKETINIRMQKDVDYDKMTKDERESLVGPERLGSIHKALKKIGNPRKTLIAIHSTIGQLVEQLDEMLGELLSGDEEVIEGGEGLKGKDTDEALSGIKLYKGETLLELTERWKLLQNKLYNEEKDTFDLSRVPDVHDNVRFDMLHNPHLGLTETLQKLYDLAKSMADCVVPQEYGITIEEKRDIGSKMCHTLLEKINYDLAIARTDNQVDMRYLINMDYSADLPINSMGRRVRSRLYFTSESHLHSLLNVLRFPSIVPSPLSLKGQAIIANASELCYLTQVVMRLFEDNQKPADSPRRFRVEILFSPGATATPLHMAELYRDKDASRYDTEKLQKISIDGLTCAQVEEYFAEAIKEGKHEDDEDVNPVMKKDSVLKKEASASDGEVLKERDSFALQDHENNGANAPDADNESDQAKCNTNDDQNALAHCSRDDDSLSATDLDNSCSWRSATILGVVMGVACIVIMARAVKGRMR